MTQRNKLFCCNIESATHVQQVQRSTKIDLCSGLRCGLSDTVLLVHSRGEGNEDKVHNRGGRKQTRHRET